MCHGEISSTIASSGRTENRTVSWEIRVTFNVTASSVADAL